MVEFSPATTEATRRCHNISKIPEEKNCQPKIQCQVKISFRNEEEVKTFSDERKLREFVTSRSVLQVTLKIVLQLGGQRGKLGMVDLLLFVIWAPSTFLCPQPRPLAVFPNPDAQPFAP